MSNRTSTVLGLGALLLVCSAGSAAREDLLKASDHEALGKQIAEYLKAYDESKNTDKALDKVVEELEKVRKKTKREPLSLHDDLGKALWASFDYDKKASTVKKGTVKDLSFLRASDDPKSGLSYALWVPAKYDAKKAYPLLLLIPDKGKKPTDQITETWTDAGLREGAVLCAVTMPAGDSTESWLELSTSREKEGGLSNAIATFFEITKTIAIDYDRIYVAGTGEGVRAAVALAARFPDRFAGAIGRSGDPVDGQAVENFRNLPTFFAGAGQGATGFSERIAAAKYDNCTLKPEGKEADMWAWIQDHPRISNPTQVVLSAAPQVGMRAYWLTTQPFDSPISVNATIDRGTNTITIDADGATDVTLFFNDVLLDLEKEVKVVCNGTPHVDKIPRNVNTLLGMIRNFRSDPGKLYVAQKKYDLPPKPKPKDKPKEKDKDKEKAGDGK